MRSYEILAEDFDPNRHLSGAYAMSAAASPEMDRPNLWKAGFFNYLREDITFSLMNCKALKIDLTNTQVPDAALDDEDQLNTAALYAAEAVNLRFGPLQSQGTTEVLEERFERWRSTLPDQFRPFYDSSVEVADDIFPTIRLLRECHVAIAQYCLVTDSLLRETGETHDDASELESSLSRNAIRMCGMAFTSNAPAVLVNSFGPVSYCGRHISTSALQADLVRRLHASGKETGWPVQRMIDDLTQYWSNKADPSHEDPRTNNYVPTLTAPG